MYEQKVQVPEESIVATKKYSEEYTEQMKKAEEARLKREAERKKHEKLQKKQKPQVQVPPVYADMTDIWGNIDVSDDDGEADFNRMYGEYQVEVHQPAFVSAEQNVKKKSWLDEDSDEESEEESFQTRLYGRSENIFEKMDRERQLREEESEEEAEVQEQEEILEVQEQVVQHQEEDQKAAAERRMERRKKFLDQTVLQAPAKFRLLSEEERNSLGKIKRNSYDKKKVAWEQNVEQQRIVADKMFALKEQADELYRNLDYSMVTSEAEALFRFDAVELYNNKIIQMQERNKETLKQLEKINQKYMQLKEELKQLKVKQGFPVSKEKTKSGDDFLGNLDRINHYLRTDQQAGEGLSPVFLASAEMMTEHMGEIGKKMLVYKSVSTAEWLEMTDRTLEDVRVDNGYHMQKFKDKGLCRASLHPEDTNDIQLVITADKTAAAVRISGAENGGGEGILLPGNTTYYILKEERYMENGQQKRRIYLSVGTE